MADLQEKAIEMWRDAYFEKHWKIRKMEDALLKIAKINNRRDRFSEEIDAIIVKALEKDDAN